MLAENYYHIYNRTNGSERLFRSNENYHYFLRQFKKYIAKIADVYAYCLIPNHFHFIVKIKSKEDLELFFCEKLSKGSKPLENLIILQFSHFFNSYTQAYNKMYKRKGSLFSPNFKKKIISDNIYLQQAILYVHLNPIKHKLTNNFVDFPHSSYLSILSNKSTLIKRKEVISLFDDEDNFIFVHKEQQVKTELIAEIINEDI
ncbi:MAG: transposase [Vicingaceae bacterium]